MTPQGVAWEFQAWQDAFFPFGDFSRSLGEAKTLATSRCPTYTFRSLGYLTTTLLLGDHVRYVANPSRCIYRLLLGDHVSSRCCPRHEAFSVLILQPTSKIPFGRTCGHQQYLARQQTRLATRIHSQKCLTWNRTHLRPPVVSRDSRMRSGTTEMPSFPLGHDGLPEQSLVLSQGREATQITPSFRTRPAWSILH